MLNKYVVWFKDVGKDDIDIVGGKGANLGEMTKNNFPVPNGFIVTAQSYFKFLDEAGIRYKIQEILNQIDINNNEQLEAKAKLVQKLIINSQMPHDIASEIIKAYMKLSDHLLSHPLVAVRSSATAEDLPTASFAGQQVTFLNVRGEANLVIKIRECWASLFTARAIFYRGINHFDHFKVGIAVPVQTMVESEKSGVMFTIDPVNSDKSKIIIEAVLGLGEMIVQGAVTPDHYEIEKKSGVILSKTVHSQEKMMLRSDGKNIIKRLDKAAGSKQKLSDAEIIEIFKLGKRLEAHYYFPQDSEWAIAKGKVYLVQTRPITTVKKEEDSAKNKAFTTKNVLLLQGNSASPGIVSGPVKIIHGASEIDKIKIGDILVAQQTNPDYVPAMRKAAGIVTERGGRTSHAAIVSRELGIPAVVGANGFMQKVTDGMIISINGATGEIWKGAVSVNKSLQTGVKKPAIKLKTATKVYVNLAESSRVNAISKLNVDGVGLLRAEFMIAGIGIHPKKLIEEKKQKFFINNLASELEKFCVAFSPRPVVYRTTDFKTNEYRNLTGGKAFEPEEPNPMLGFRGAARYVANADVFELELEAIKMVRNKMGHKNLWIMLPFVRTPEELLEVKKIIASVGLLRSPTFKLWMMVEIPTNVIRLEDFLDVGIDGVSIGSNDLTMLILGTDRDNSEVAHDFSEKDPSVIWALERVIKICNEKGVTASICGQAPSDYPDLVERLVSKGITSVSVNPDAVDQVRETIYEAEKKLVLKKR